MSVQAVEYANGDHAIGAIIEGEFVPFFTLSKGKIAQHVQRAQILKERAGEGDALAQDQIGKPLAETGSGSGVSSKSTVAELDSYADEHGIAEYPSSGTKAAKLGAIKAHEDAGAGE